MDISIKQGLSAIVEGIKENGLDKLFGHIKTVILIWNSIGVCQDLHLKLKQCW